MAEMQDHFEEQQAAQQPGALSTKELESGRSERDLGTAGGGSIPRPADIDPDKTAAEAEKNNDSSYDPNSPNRGNTADVREPGEVNNASEVNPHSEGNVGTRDPGQPSTAMGDRDKTFGGRGAGTNEETIDPMTSRAPDKVNQSSEQEQSQEQA